MYVSAQLNLLQRRIERTERIMQKLEAKIQADEEMVDAHKKARSKCPGPHKTMNRDQSIQ